MLPGNQDVIIKPIKRRGRPKKMDDGRLDQIMSEYVVQPQGGQECRAIMGDAGIADDIKKKHGVRLSPDFVYRYRLQHNIAGHGMSEYFVRPSYKELLKVTEGDRVVVIDPKED